MEWNSQINFIASQTAVTEQQIAEFEKQIGFKFPSDYRAFLSALNGPTAKPRDGVVSDELSNPGFPLSDPDLPNLDSLAVSWWMGFADPKADYKYGMIERYEVHHVDWRLPPGIVAIAGTAGPGCIYINLSNDSRKNHILLVGDTVVERQGDELEIDSSHFVSVASSFTEFVSSLRWI